MPYQLTQEPIQNLTRLFISYMAQKNEAEAVSDQAVKEYFAGKVYGLVETFGVLLGITWQQAFDEFVRVAATLPEVIEAPK